jgi:hypothetical protein
MQNLAPSGFSNWHFEHFMPAPAEGDLLNGYLIKGVDNSFSQQNGSVRLGDMRAHFEVLLHLSPPHQGLEN